MYYLTIDSQDFTGGKVDKATAEFNYSEIVYYDISDPNGRISKESELRVDGLFMDRFKLDYYDGYLRAVAYDFDENVTNLYMIEWEANAEPDIRATLSLATSEQLFGTRFKDDIGIIVTAYVEVEVRAIDPLFVIDLSNPEDPKIASELKDIPGWSDHLEIIGDKLFALGQEDRRVKVAYFDLSDIYDVMNRRGEFSTNKLDKIFEGYPYRALYFRRDNYRDSADKFMIYSNDDNLVLWDGYSRDIYTYDISGRNGMKMIGEKYSYLSSFLSSVLHGNHYYMWNGFYGIHRVDVR